MAQYLVFFQFSDLSVAAQVRPDPDFETLRLQWNPHFLYARELPEAAVEHFVDEEAKCQRADLVKPTSSPLRRAKARECLADIMGLTGFEDEAVYLGERPPALGYVGVRQSTFIPEAKALAKLAALGLYVPEE